jgi:hypothetical protein
MVAPQILPCDGCGQLAAPDHIARRLARLELATRYRPVHIQTLLLGAVAPEQSSGFLYSADGIFDGEAGLVLSALEIAREGKSREAVLTDFQKRGLLLSHVLECAVDTAAASGTLPQLLEAQLPAALARLRRSLKPKRIIVISRELRPLMGKLSASELGCPVSFVDLEATTSTSAPCGVDFEAFRGTLGATGAS